MYTQNDVLYQQQKQIAYPTVVLALVAAVGYVIAFIAGVREQLGTGWVVLINSVAAYLLFTPMHEASHYNITGQRSAWRWLNEGIGWGSGITLLAPLPLFRVLHFRHHAHTNHPEKDPDHWVAAQSLVSLLAHTTTIFPVYVYRAWQLLRSDQKLPRQIRRDLRVSFIALSVFAAVLIALGSWLSWPVILTTWILPAAIAQGFLAFTFDWLPHHPHRERARFRHTRIIDVPGLSFLLLGQNYHLIHHLYPNLPFYKYKAVYQDMQDDLEQKGTEIISLSSNTHTDPHSSYD